MTGVAFQHGATRAPAKQIHFNAMGKATGFLDTERETIPNRPPLERIKDWKEIHAHRSDEKVMEQGSRCMDCGTPYCHTGLLISGMASGCPINNLIPEFNDLVYRNRWQEALERLRKTNNFPEFTGRVCPVCRAHWSALCCYASVRKCRGCQLLIGAKSAASYKPKYNPRRFNSSPRRRSMLATVS